MNNFEKGSFIENKENFENKEIERKFLIERLPENIDDFEKKEIVQGYLAVAEDGTEVRLRKKGEKYFQTVKSGGGKIRSEFEIEITKEQFDAFWPATEGKRVEKIRYNVVEGENIIEIDIYSGDLEGLVIGEIEFKSEEDSNNFISPSWLGKEVTEDKRYKNKVLATKGLPQEKIEEE